MPSAATSADAEPVVRILVAEGNGPAVRRRSRELTGQTPGESYAAVLRRLAPDAQVDVACPADPDPGLPAGLESYDAVAVTGSALNIHRREPESLRQIGFASEVFARGQPMFGSCWGLQLAAVAAGGDVARNPRGREVAFARKVTLTDAGRGHGMHAGRAVAFDAPAIHGDEIVTLPPDAVVTASNAVSQVQAAEIRHGKGVFWGVQYHPEYRLDDVSAVIRRYGQVLVDEGFFASLETLDTYAGEIDLLHATPTRADIAWRLAIGRDILVEEERLREIANWLALRVRNGA